MSEVFRGFNELEVFVDDDFVHIRQQDGKDSWVIIPRYMWSSVAQSIYRQIHETYVVNNTESAE